MSSSLNEVAPHGYVLRQALLSDIPCLGTIESSAGSLFRTVSLSAVASDPPMSQIQLSQMCETQNLWVASLDSTEEVVAFLAAHEMSIAALKSSEANASNIEVGPEPARYLHIAELSTHAQHQRQGLASALMRVAISESLKRRLTGLSLTTYRDVIFNRPFYERFGFREADPQSVGIEYEEFVQKELKTIHAPDRRCFMVKSL